MNTCMKFQEIMEGTGLEDREVELRFSENGFDLCVELGSCVPIEVGAPLADFCDRLYCELREQKFEMDEPFRYDIEDGEIVLKASFYRTS